MKDKLLVAKLRSHVKKGTVADLFSRDESTTREHLVAFGFSPLMIERFFEPFFSGIFLERELVTSSRFFEFLFRMFSFSDAAVPENGMEMIPRQLAVRLRAETLQVNTQVVRLRRERTGFVVDTRDGKQVAARNVVLALPDPQVRQLLDGISGRAKLGKDVQWNRTTTFYYSSHRTPIADPILILNGEGPKAGPVNNAVVMSQVSAGYAPAGAHLISASVVGQATGSAVKYGEAGERSPRAADQVVRPRRSALGSDWRLPYRPGPAALPQRPVAAKRRPVVRRSVRLRRLPRDAQHSGSLSLRTTGCRSCSAATTLT